MHAGADRPADGHGLYEPIMQSFPSIGPVHNGDFAAQSRQTICRLSRSLPELSRRIFVKSSTTLFGISHLQKLQRSKSIRQAGSVATHPESSNKLPCTMLADMHTQTGSQPRGKLPDSNVASMAATSV